MGSAQSHVGGDSPGREGLSSIAMMCPVTPSQYTCRVCSSDIHPSLARAAVAYPINSLSIVSHPSSTINIIDSRPTLPPFLTLPVAADRSSLNYSSFRWHPKLVFFLLYDIARPVSCCSMLSRPVHDPPSSFAHPHSGLQSAGDRSPTRRLKQSQCEVWPAASSAHLIWQADRFRHLHTELLSPP